MRCRSYIRGGTDGFDGRGANKVLCVLPSGHRGWHAARHDRKGAQWQTPTRHYVVVKNAQKA
jgi:hypothetical protein